MPVPLRAGPYYVLGLARAQKQQWGEAALAWLRTAILFPEHRALAARSLLDAGQSLERLGRAQQANRVRIESKDQGRASQLARLLDHSLDDARVAQVHAVKVSDCDRPRTQLTRQVGYLSQQLHDCGEPA